MTRTLVTKLKRSRSQSIQLFIIALIFSVLSASCSTLKLWIGIGSFKKPEVEYLKSNLEDLSTSGARFSIQFKIKNPNPYALVFKDLKYNIYLDKEQVAKGQIAKPIEVLKEADSVVDLPLELDYKTLLLKGLAVSLLGPSDSKDSDLRDREFLKITGDGIFAGDFGEIEKNFEKSIPKNELKEILKKKIL